MHNVTNLLSLFNQAKSFKTIFNVCYGLTMIICCSWQISTIFEFYLSYPTTIFIDTKFNKMEEQLPAISFCHWGGKDVLVNTSKASFDKFNLNSILNVSVQLAQRELIRDLTSYFWENSLECVSQEYYCFTLNSFVKGNISYYCMFKHDDFRIPR